MQNYPNPFNGTTVIKFFVGTYGYTSLRVYDILGRETAVLVDEIKPVGTYSVRCDAANMASGVYFYRMQAGSYTETKKMIVMK